MRNAGKYTLEWLKTRRKWIRLNPPDHQGYYLCGICAKPVHISEMELDHIVARSSDPASRFVLDNLQPTHGWNCNRKKGSKSLKPLVSASEYELRRKLGL